jgi:hypothetical protein
MKRSSSGVSRYKNSASCPPTIANNLYTYFDATMNRVLLIRAFRYRLQPFQEIRPRATSHTGLRARDHYTSSSLVGGQKAEPVQVRFTQHLTDPRSLWMEDGCKVYMDSYMASNRFMFHGHLDYFQKPSLWGRPNTKLGDHGTPNVHNRWFFLFYYVWGPAWIESHWNIIWLRALSHMTSHYTWGHVTTLHDFGGVLRWPLDTFFWVVTISWSRLLARMWSGPEIFHALIHFQPTY